MKNEFLWLSEPSAKSCGVDVCMKMDDRKWNPRHSSELFYLSEIV